MYIYKNIITIESGKRSGKPCIRGMRITVEDILRYLAAEMTIDEILSDFPELTKEDVLVALEFSANRQHRTMVASSI
ncbi:MAG: DUF433 domain-containing protein [Saprospiraceae bacterium]|jgi:uncharacterized protein (DUF433 family)|nr:DUF433 domain-containing protein [Saprospiraceae bacterium]